MIKIIRTTPENADFQKLIALLDIDIQERDGEDHVFFAQFNKTDNIKNAIVIYDDQIAVGCGAFKFYKEDVAEIKRMYVYPKTRGKGIASKILIELESWAREENYTSCILETGHKYPEAVALYKKNGFAITENYGQYIGVADSICFQKDL
ncbi:GNAT family N-acetyltransferase [Flavobacterium sp. 14A]|uniref:GNAT family N-acetyltransferase n=1 Tax=Flavobacterium sp. 14A TaxID=2735896 RepID=UPI00156DCAE3|nr:GNAT family N-acetyltransferase [Flavobacterium sp. 14A]NRT12580.1 GNAT superfamily N-acetyltransferase [Flavobacterium sp. 14A]